MNKKMVIGSDPGIRDQYFVLPSKKVNIVKTVKAQEKPLRCKACIIVVRLFLFAIFIVSICGFVMMWFTEFYNNTVLSNLVLSENSTALKLWATPPVPPFLRVYVFNYTNSDDYIKGRADKLMVQELGPYVYQEDVAKVNLEFNANGTITYREKRNYKFMEHLSNGRRNDYVVVPNIPLISMEKKYSQMSTFRQATIRFGVKFGLHLFKKLEVDQFLWGYDDVITSVAKQFNLTDFPFDKFGVLINRNGTARDSLTVHNGERDLSQIYQITNVNGNTKINIWPDEPCDSVRGTDGTQFSPSLLDRKTRLDIFIKELCSSLPLDYLEDVKLIDDVPAMRYVASENVFASPHINSENECFCTKSEMNKTNCPPSGIHNTSVCYFGSPILLSFPHFLGGEAKLFDKIIGLQPDPVKHRTFADIHPRLGFAMAGASRFQVNVAVPKSDMDSSFKRFDDDILPVIWFELVPGVMSEEIRNLVYHSWFSLNALQGALEYGTLMIALLSLGLLAMTFFWCGQRDILSVEEQQMENMKLKEEDT